MTRQDAEERAGTPAPERPGSLARQRKTFMKLEFEIAVFRGQLYQPDYGYNTYEAIPPQAGQVQPVVGPPDAAITPSEPGRWPDRLTSSKVIGLIEEEYSLLIDSVGPIDICADDLRQFVEVICQQIEELDKGGSEATRQDDGE